MINSRSHESFQCREVSIAIPWPGTVKGDPPPAQVHSKRNSKRSSTSQTPSSCSSPTKEDGSVSGRRNSGTDSPPKEEACPCPSPSPSPATNNKKQLPPLPKKNGSSSSGNGSGGNNNNNNNVESTPSPEDDPSMISRSESNIGDSFSSAVSSSARHGDSSAISATPSPSSSWPSTWSWFDSSHGNNSIQANAWGMVIVTATLGGEIRAYQNFGLPRRIGRQTNLF
ncbi:hypothetical protein JCGZ_09064 [Jatropha curcas]|uniref:Uncharacterized protein n=2 Tax=Jatropha curcas TaxID=180498 RepID=A0A067KHB2_JATCU|nr:hypothetical protein JCGZ_09064 [Jatropha curcas]